MKKKLKKVVWRNLGMMVGSPTVMLTLMDAVGYKNAKWKKKLTAAQKKNESIVIL